MGRLIGYDSEPDERSGIAGCWRLSVAPYVYRKLKALKSKPNLMDNESLPLRVLGETLVFDLLDIFAGSSIEFAIKDSVVNSSLSRMIVFLICSFNNPI
jgi:hypothetical protein